MEFVWSWYGVCRDLVWGIVWGFVWGRYMVLVWVFVWSWYGVGIKFVETWYRLGMEFQVWTRYGVCMELVWSL